MEDAVRRLAGMDLAVTEASVAVMTARDVRRRRVRLIGVAVLRVGPRVVRSILIALARLLSGPGLLLIAEPVVTSAVSQRRGRAWSRDVLHVWWHRGWIVGAHHAAGR